MQKRREKSKHLRFWGAAQCCVVAQPKSAVFYCYVANKTLRRKRKQYSLSRRDDSWQPFLVNIPTCFTKKTTSKYLIELFKWKLIVRKICQTKQNEKKKQAICKQKWGQRRWPSASSEKSIKIVQKSIQNPTSTMCTSWLQSCCLQWRSWIRPLLILVYLLFVVIVVPLLIVNSVKDGFSRKDQLILIGGLFVLSAIPISIWQITQHVVHFTRPILQKHIIR